MPSFALRDGAIVIRELINLYMASYTGRDPSRSQRLSWWVTKLGDTVKTYESREHAGRSDFKGIEGAL